MSYQVIFTDELYHHGIKGQKWGVRRYRNPDGTLTDTGKARYDAKEANKEARQARNDWASARRNFIRKESRDNSRQKKKEYYESVENLKNKRAKAKEVDKIIKSIKNDPEEAKKYNKMYEELAKKFDTVDKLWEEADKKYRDTGKNRVAAIINNIKYS